MKNDNSRPQNSSKKIVTNGVVKGGVNPEKSQITQRPPPPAPVKPTPPSQDQ